MFETENYISRLLEDVLNAYAKLPEIIAIIGPRQCGKSIPLFKNL